MGHGHSNASFPAAGKPVGDGEKAVNMEKDYNLREESG